jgi:4-hydroxy-3-polyprenylbenzoate decarboxylase
VTDTLDSIRSPIESETPARKSWDRLSDYVAGLDKAGQLVRVTREINKDTQLHPLVRLQFRGLQESQRKAFLFENVVDSKGRKYDIPVLVGAMAGTSQIYALGMNCKVEEIFGIWGRALANPLPPVYVTEAPCQEIKISGNELKRNGLSRLPVPISTPGFDNAPYTSASHWVTKDPDTGLHNIGNYRGMVKSENRIGVLLSTLGMGMRRHVDQWRERGAKRMPAAIVIGAPPHLTYTAVTRVPNDVCEYDVAGALAGKPLELVRCATQDLFVPAESEIVIEGTVPMEELEMEGAFGEYPGYMAKRDFSFFMDVECITMRRKPIFLAMISQLPPSESSKIRQIGRSAAAKKALHDGGFTNVIEVNYPECGGADAIAVVKLRKEKPDDGMKVLEALAARYISKTAISVDEDVNAQDLDHVMACVAWRAQPYRDIKVIDVPLSALDPSVTPPGAERGLVGDVVPRSSAVLIDATMSWAYPPLSLPKREFMEEAIHIWEELQFPSLRMKDPWYGQSFGQWTAEEDEEAKLAIQGRHFETGDKQRLGRKPFPRS